MISPTKYAINMMCIVSVYTLNGCSAHSRNETPSSFDCASAIASTAGRAKPAPGGVYIFGMAALVLVQILVLEMVL